MHNSPLALLAIYLWFPLVIFFLLSFSARTAIIISYIYGVLFLPKSIGLKIPLLAFYGDDNATSYALLVGIIILSLTKTIDSKELKEFKFKSIDIPIVMTCLSPVFASFANGLGLHMAIKEFFIQSFIFGIPYFLGRIYINNLAGLKELCINIIRGALIYVPLCLYETKFSPILHQRIYGYFAHSSGTMQAYRMGGWRPQVFMIHGLVVALWMVSAVILILWLWQSKTIKKIWNVEIKYLVGILLFTFVMLKSTSVIFYLIYVIIIFLFARYLKSNFPAWFLVCFLILFLAGRATLILPEPLVHSVVSGFVASDRDQSFDFRLVNEDQLTAKALQRPIFGWGGYGRNRIFKEDDFGDIRDDSVTDSTWIIQFGTNGFLGLISLYATFFIPIILFLRRYRTWEWLNPNLAPMASLSIVLLIFIWDTIYNAGLIAIFPLICGSLTGVLARKPIVRIAKKPVNNKNMIKNKRLIR